MPARFNIYCPHCGKATTIGIGPKQIGFVPEVNCSLCNKRIDASKGQMVQIKSRTKVGPKTDLLGISS